MDANGGELVLEWEKRLLERIAVFAERFFAGDDLDHFGLEDFSSVGDGADHDCCLKRGDDERVLPDGEGIESCFVQSDVVRKSTGDFTWKLNACFLAETEVSTGCDEIQWVFHALGCQNGKVDVARLFECADDVDFADVGVASGKLAALV